ncbi:hypothetical protein LshimejAT787_1501330 [Lyophyllum shimeji]|uniref:DUF4219 domain-containing protein n=1 Tax=Lyophyllum shimeji TaxID=47721 RepID=A0A9P3PYQ9_LYOSH|nr:hypothetical protein LshimejAT787_1501330 [Lyophyllum shimeji]
MASNALFTLVPVFDGTNYVLWASNMSDVLRAQGLWQIVAGNDPKPEELDSTQTPAPTAAAIGEREKERLAWDKEDDKAVRMIRCRLSEGVKQQIAVGDSSEDQWNKSKLYLGRLNPDPEISKLVVLFERLTANSIELPEFVKAMILLVAIPQKWDTVPATLIQNKTVENLTLSVVREAIMAEYHRRSTSNAHTANKISAVKRKGKAPAWQKQGQQRQAPQQPQQSSSTAPQQQGEKKKRKRGGKAVQARKAEKAHLAMASVSEIAPLIERLNPTPKTADPCLMQRFSGVDKTPSKWVYPTYQEARNQIAELDLPATARILEIFEERQMEVDRHGRREFQSCPPSPGPSSKHQRLEEMIVDDVLDFGDGNNELPSEEDPELWGGFDTGMDADPITGHYDDVQVLFFSNQSQSADIRLPQKSFRELVLDCVICHKGCNVT